MMTLEQRVIALETKARRWRLAAVVILLAFGLQYLIAAQPAPRDLVGRSLAIVNAEGKPLLTVSDGKGGMILSLRSADGDGEIRMEPMPNGGYFHISNKGWNLASISAQGNGSFELCDDKAVVFRAPEKKQ